MRTLLDSQLADGGWNCWDERGATVGSFDSTICVLEGLLEWERWTGGTPASTGARRRGEEYLLERQLFRRRSTGEIAVQGWLRLAFPNHWHYDVLRALDYFRLVDVRDPRMAAAVSVAVADDAGARAGGSPYAHQGC